MSLPSAFRQDLFAVMQRRCSHVSATTAVTAPDATSDATALTLATAIRAALVEHFASVTDGSGVGAHAAADTATAMPAASPRSSTRVWLRDLASALSDHAARGDLHLAQGSPISDNSDVSPAGMWRFANDLKAAVNAHIASALASAASG